MLTAPQIYLIASAALVSLGLYAIMSCPNLVRKLLGINVLGNGVFLLLIAIAQAPENSDRGPDPVPQAMVLTGIVVAVCATAFSLTLIERYRAATGSLTLEERGNDV